MNVKKQFLLFKMFFNRWKYFFNVYTDIYYWSDDLLSDYCDNFLENCYKLMTDEIIDNGFFMTDKDNKGYVLYSRDTYSRSNYARFTVFDSKLTPSFHEFLKDKEKIVDSLGMDLNKVLVLV